MKAASPLRSRAFGGPSRSRTAKGICGKAEEPFLFSGKYRKEKWVLICAGHVLQTGKKNGLRGLQKIVLEVVLSSRTKKTSPGCPGEDPAYAVPAQ